MLKAERGILVHHDGTMIQAIQSSSLHVLSKMSLTTRLMLGNFHLGDSALTLHGHTRSYASKLTVSSINASLITKREMSEKMLR